jgi:hypothetical protein
MPELVPATPKTRTAIFLHHNYYNFKYLAAALRRQGWDAISVAVDNPDGPLRQYYHGEDINLFNSDYSIMRENVRAFLRTVPERFGALHFAGMGHATFFPEAFESSEAPVQPPFDLMELRRHRLIIGYTPSGCLDGATQTDIRAATNGLCSRCVWELRPDICKDERSAAWAERLDHICDWIGIEGDWPVGARKGTKYVHEPVITALDPELWRPDISVPDEYRILREPNAVLIYHAFGNDSTRRVNGRDIKGTNVVFATIEKLKAEGLAIQLVFATNIPSQHVRFLQVQSDIIVDQLYYGRYGATAREGFMLGKPVIIRVDPRQPPPLPPLRSVAEAPVANSDAKNLPDVLRRLVVDASMRSDLGRRAREFGLAWHGADGCAKRYGLIVERLRSGLPPRSNDWLPGEPELAI